MHFHAFMSVLFLSLLLGCGEDISSNRRLAYERTTQGQEGNLNLLINSHLHRNRGINMLSSLAEIELILGANLPSGYRTIPDIRTDDEGTDNGNIITVSAKGRPTAACGVGEAFRGIDARITDCFGKNGEAANWNGTLFGAAGESFWSLVSLTNSGKEIWLDRRTGLVWSDINSSANWCKATGNAQDSSLSPTINCDVEGESSNVCSNALNDTTQANIRWRLPTRNDYLQADLNGLRFVLKTGNTIGSWTATLRAASESRSEAWVYHFNDGTLSAQDMLSLREVRCIGASAR